VSVSVVLLGGSSPTYRRQRPVAVALASTWLKGGAGHLLLNFQSYLGVQARLAMQLSMTSSRDGTRKSGGRPQPREWISSLGIQARLTVQLSMTSSLDGRSRRGDQGLLVLETSGSSHPYTHS
jgi:hypothetical protein